MELKVESIVAVCAGGTAGGPRCWHMPIDPKTCDTYVIKTEAETLNLLDIGSGPHGPHVFFGGKARA